jgi:hypothetical protein
MDVNKPRLVSGLVLWAAVCCHAIGCQARSDSGTLGEQGKVAFSYQGAGCFFGCPLEQPLLAGTRERVALTGPGDARAIEVASSKPTVVEVALERACFCERGDESGARLDVAEEARCDAGWSKHCDNTVLVQTKAAGRAFVELRTVDGRLIDRAAVLVREAARALIEATAAGHLGRSKVGTLELGPNEQVQLYATLYDQKGFELLAPEGVHWSVDDDTVAIVSAFLVGGGKQLDAGTSVVLEAKAVGTTVLTLSVPGLDQTVDVTVTPK